MTNKFWSPIVRQLDPYVPGEQPQDQQYIKLNTNESPYPPAPAVAATLAAFDCERLRRYPDPESLALRDALAAYHGLVRDQVFVGNGSDEVLAHAFQALLQKPAPILYPDISYSFYPVYCALYQIEYATVPLDAEFRIDVDAYRPGNGGIIIANPNAPTGIALPLEAIRRLLANNREGVVIIDEAYVDFGAESATSLIEDFDNLLVPSITLTEVFKTVVRQRDEHVAAEVIAQMKRGHVISLDESLAVEAAECGLQFGLPLADSIIYATARKFDAVVWTQDTDFAELSGVKYFARQ